LLSDLTTPIDQAPPQSGPALFLDYASTGKPGRWRFWLVVLAAPILAIVSGAIVLALGLVVTGNFKPDTLKALQDPGQTGPFFSLVAVTFGALLFWFWGAGHVIQGKRFGDIIGRWRWSLVAKGFGLWLVVVVLSVLVDFLLRPQGFTLSPDLRAPGFVLWVAPALAIQTFTEEFIFRGVITQALVRVIKRPWLACLLSGLVFGAMHIPNGAVQAASAAVLGVVLAFLAIETGGLALGWGLHLVNNLFAGIVVVSSGDVFHGAPGLIHQNTPGLDGVDLAFNVVAPLAAAWLLLRKPAASPAPEAETAST
jgi:membrane protease YdiL (CAAX protease family)